MTHRHIPVFDEYYRTESGGQLYYRVGLFHCSVDGCEAKGQQEEWPQEDDKVIWRYDRKEDSSSRV